MCKLVCCYRNLKLITKMTKLRNYSNITKVFAIYYVTIIISHDSCMWPNGIWCNA